MNAGLDAVQRALDDLRAGRGSTGDCVAILRDATLPDALPARYGEVLQQLADRLESSALFAGESCSFSQHDLLDALQDWLARAQARLAA